jgi:hypothetical protein
VIYFPINSSTAEEMILNLVEGKMLINQLLTGQEFGVAPLPKMGTRARRCRKHPAGGREPAAQGCEAQADVRYICPTKRYYNIAARLTYCGQPRSQACDDLGRVAGTECTWKCEPERTKIESRSAIANCTAALNLGTVPKVRDSSQDLWARQDSDLRPSDYEFLATFP